ncbi:MAG: hypothetical protein AAB910_02905, partial [Patescibacteria group bacterium]
QLTGNDTSANLCIHMRYAPAVLKRKIHFLHRFYAARYLNHLRNRAASNLNGIGDRTPAANSDDRNNNENGRRTQNDASPLNLG